MPNIDWITNTVRLDRGAFCHGNIALRPQIYGSARVWFEDGEWSWSVEIPVLPGASVNVEASGVAPIRATMAEAKALAETWLVTLLARFPGEGH